MIAQQPYPNKTLRDVRVFDVISKQGNNALVQKRLTDNHCKRNEMAVIGAAIQDKAALYTASSMLKHTDFTLLLASAVWYCIQQLADRGEAVDILSILNESRTNDKVAKVLHGDDISPYLAECIMACPNANNVRSYAAQILDFGTRWRLAGQLASHVMELTTNSLNLPDIMDKISSSILEASRTLYTPPTSAHATMTEYYERVSQMYEANLNGGGGDPTILTHFTELDVKTGGLFPGTVTVLLGESGRGKTTMALSTIRHFMKAGYRAKYFTLEMSQEEIIRALTAMETGISRTMLRKGTLTPQEYSLFVKAAGDISTWPLDIIDEWTSMTPAQMMRRLRLDMLKEQVDVVVVDGLWLMEASEPTGNRPQDVGQMLRDLTAYAKELDVPIYLLHQYKNALGNRRPQLSDFSESTKGYKTAQTIWAMYRVETEDGQEKTYIDVLKDRGGSSTGETIEFYYNREFSRYEGGGVQHVAENNVRM